MHKPMPEQDDQGQKHARAGRGAEVGGHEPELPPATAGTPLSAAAEAEPMFRISAAWPYVGAVVGGISLVLVLGLVFIGRPMATSAKAEAATKADAADAAVNSGVKGPGERFLTERTPAKAELPRTKTAVLVLNGSGTRGAAREAAARLESERYRVIDTNDAAHPDYRRTLVLYRKGFRGEAERLARDLGLGWKRVAPVDGMKRRELGQARVVLILGG